MQQNKVHNSPGDHVPEHHITEVGHHEAHDAVPSLLPSLPGVHSRFGFGKRAVNPKKGYEKKEDIPKNNSEPPSYYKSSGNVKREAIPLPDTEHGYYRNYGNGYSESYL